MNFSNDPHGQPIIRAFNAARLSDRAIDEMIGIAKGILFDGVVDETEAKNLMRWMQANQACGLQWPANILYGRISEMLADGKLDLEEQRELMDLLMELTGDKLEKFSARQNSTGLPLCNPQPSIKFRDRAFCFTGKFAYGTRDRCQDAIEYLGGLAVRAIRRDLNYLVIGSIGSSDWIHSTHGRKIEQAVSYREAGLPLSIVSEEHWVSHVMAATK